MRAAQASLVIAMTIPIKTNTTIAACIQIHVGDIDLTAYGGASYSALWNNAATVNSIIFKSRPSDQWAM
jgi:hypothetical protein